MKRIAISQSNYIPWKGYFDMISSVDEFIIYDDMQYTRRDWRNRNKIKTATGPSWLTIPVQVKGRYLQKIRDTFTDGDEWAMQHWRTIEQNYKKSPYFNEVKEILYPIYTSETIRSGNLSAINRVFIEKICNYLGIKTIITNSWDYSLADGKNERLADLCLQAKSNTYISGPAARDYIDPDVFQHLGITLEWFNYDDYPPYVQQWGDFFHNVSIIDVMFNCGPTSPRFIKKKNHG